MSNSASQRRFRKRAANLSRLMSEDPSRFVRVWETFVQGWISEINARRKAWQFEGEDAPKDIFGVFDQARRLARAIGAERHVIVAMTLVDLRNECAKTVSHTFSYRLYRLDEDCTTRVRRHVGGWP